MAPGGDNWPITWGDDDFLYTAYGDGFGFEPLLNEKLSLGFARVGGAPPNITGENIRSATGEQKGDGARGVKASGMLMALDVLYMWVRNLRTGNALLAWSENHARDWYWCAWKFDAGFGCPTFLNFGKNYSGARDEFVYVYSQDSNSAYDAADRMVLARVLLGHLRSGDMYEFFEKLGSDGRPVWTKDIRRRGAVFSFPGHCYRSGISYNAGLKRYLWCQILPAEAPRFSGGFGIYDAPEPWGPWTTAYFTERWDVGPGETSSIPPKWISADGRTAHLVFSGDDAFSVRRMRIVLRGAAQQGGNLPSIEKIRRWDAGRERWQKPDALVASMNLRPGARVADVGSGAGYLVARLARAVGKTGRVVAQDVDPLSIELLGLRAAADGWRNVDIVQGTHTDPNIETATLDAAAVLLTYHTMKEPEAMLRGLFRALKPGGRLVVCEPQSSPAATAETRIRSAGFDVVSREDDFCADGFQGEPHRLWLIVAEKRR
jgi:precorrin-6B methylase 2